MQPENERWEVRIARVLIGWHHRGMDISTTAGLFDTLGTTRNRLYRPLQAMVDLGLITITGQRVHLTPLGIQRAAWIELLGARALIGFPDEGYVNVLETLAQATTTLTGYDLGPNQPHGHAIGTITAQLQKEGLIEDIRDL